MASDGRRFLLTVMKDAPTNLAPAQMIFVQHWFEELKGERQGKLNVKRIKR